MKIIPASTSDIKEMTDLWVRFMDYHRKLNDYHTINARAPDRYREFMADCITKDDMLVLIAKEDGRIIGRTVCQIMNYPPIYDIKKYGLVMEFHITEPFRRRGYGQALFKAAADWFRERGIKRIELDVTINNDPAVAFYKSLGFKDLYKKLRLDL